MAEMYDQESTKASKKELTKFVEFCEQKFKLAPTVIGGWAVYAFGGKEQSIDVDVVFSSKKVAHKVMSKFFRARGYKKKEFHDQQEHFLKEIKKGNKIVELRFDYFSFEDKNKLAEDSRISIPFRLVENNFEHKKIGDTKIKVPSIELLLLYKVKALRDRDAAINIRGIRIPKEKRLWLKSKILKDKRDIKELINTGKIDEEKLEKLLKQTNFKHYFNYTMKELEMS